MASHWQNKINKQTMIYTLMSMMFATLVSLVVFGQRLSINKLTAQWNEYKHWSDWGEYVVLRPNVSLSVNVNTVHSSTINIKTHIDGFTNMDLNTLMDKWTAVIQKQREWALSKPIPAKWTPARGHKVSLNQQKPEYFEKLKNPTLSDYLQTTVIYISSEEAKHVLPSKFYDCTSNSCKNILKLMTYGGNFGEYYLGSKCHDLNLTAADQPWMIPHGIEVAKRGFSIGMPPPIGSMSTIMKSDNSYPATYFHVIRDGIVTGGGDVYSRSTRILIQRCGQAGNRHPGSGARRTVDELITTSQFWGMGFYHFTSENLPRIAPFVKFLKDNPQVKIHVFKVGYGKIFMNLLGVPVPSGRLVSGTAAGRILYLPAGTPCGKSTFFNTNLLSLQFKQNIKTKPKRDTVLLIHRTGKRNFLHHAEIFYMLRREAAKRKLKIIIHHDNRRYSYSQVRIMYNSALMIVAPHGAGLANMFFSEPGTVIIEAMAKMKPLCFRNSAVLLGMRHHALYVSNIKQTRASQIQPAVDYYLNYIMKLKSQNETSSSP